jgi:dTDP-4-dehydrorhamnose 3,5-epimerase
VKVQAAALPGVLLIVPELHEDHRGHLFEAFRADVLAAHGVPAFVQDTQARSARGVLRGLHYQLRRPQGRLVRVLSGAIFDVAVDLRRGSPTFGRYVGFELSADDRRQLYVPPGFAHGYCALADDTDVLYKSTDTYSGADDQRGVRYDDPRLGIAWPVASPVLSARDSTLPLLDAAHLPGA